MNHFHNSQLSIIKAKLSYIKKLEPALTEQVGLKYPSEALSLVHSLFNTCPDTTNYPSQLPGVSPSSTS